MHVVEDYEFSLFKKAPFNLDIKLIHNRNNLINILKLNNYIH